MKKPRADLLLFPVVLLMGVLFGTLQVAALPGVPMHGRYHASDMDDLQQQLLGISVMPKPYAAASDHPAWHALCGMYQTTSKAFGLTGMRLWNLVTPLLLGLNLCLFMGLARRLRFDRRQALVLTAVLLSTGATVTWSVVLETHVLALTSLLLAALLITDPRLASRLWRRPTPGAIGSYGVAVALAASITITNIMLAILAVIPLRLLRDWNPVRLAARTLHRLPTLVTAILVGIGILSLVHLTGWYFFKDRDMRQFLEVLNERRLIQGMKGSWWDSVLCLSWIAPPMDAYRGDLSKLEMLALERNWITAPAYLSGLLTLVLTTCSLRVIPARRAFIPAFVLFGVLLHSIYGLGESFLFASNYTWASVLAIGCLAREVTPRWFVSIGTVVAVTLFVVNVLIWKHGIDWIIRNDYLLPG